MLLGHSCMENQEHMQFIFKVIPVKTCFIITLSFSLNWNMNITRSKSISDICFCNYCFCLAIWLCHIKNYYRNLYHRNLCNSTLAFSLTSQMDQHVPYSNTLKQMNTEGTNCSTGWCSWMPASLTNKNFCSTVFNFDGKQSPGLAIKSSLARIRCACSRSSCCWLSVADSSGKNQPGWFFLWNRASAEVVKFFCEKVLWHSLLQTAEPSAVWWPHPR